MKPARPPLPNTGNSPAVRSAAGSALPYLRSIKSPTGEITAAPATSCTYLASARADAVSAAAPLAAILSSSAPSRSPIARWSRSGGRANSKSWICPPLMCGTAVPVCTPSTWAVNAGLPMR